MSASACIGLLIRTPPYRGRSGRDQLDLALAAATLGYDLKLFFEGQGALQLLAGSSSRAAGLPAGVKGWSALPELTGVEARVSALAYRRLSQATTQWSLDVEPVSPDAARKWLATCERVMVL